jgi:phage terminase large subunit-like protein
METTIPRNQLTVLKNKARRAGWLKWIRSEADERALLNGCHFSSASAEHVATFFRQFLRHSKGEWAGRSFELLPWQWEDVIAPLFGWLRASGVRRYSKAYVEIPKKNGKSTLAAAIGLYMLAGDNEEGAEVYSTATDRRQAGIVHDEAIRMVDASPELSAALEINRSSFNIAYPETKSFYRALAATPAGQEGLNAHCIIADELHVWYGRASWDALRYAFRARRQGLLFAITTAGTDPTSVCREQHDYSKAVAAGTVSDDRQFSYIRAADPKDDWSDPEVWKKANPSLGTIIRLDDLAADYREAEKTPSAQAAFKRYSLNLWSTSSTPWIDIAKWRECAAAFTEADLEGQTCYAGLDLALKRDTTAIALVFPWESKPGGEWRYRLLTYFFLPEDTAERQRTLIPWREWAEKGHIILTPGNVADFAFIRQFIVELAGRFNLRSLAFDRMFAHQMSLQLKDDDGIDCLEFPQTIMAFAEPTATLERLILARDIEHNSNAVMDWQMGNVNVRRDANNNMRPVKPPDGEIKKIDGPVAAIMGLLLAMRGEAPSAYETPGSLSIWEDTTDAGTDPIRAPALPPEPEWLNDESLWTPR